jgi:LysM repeat protein
MARYPFTVTRRRRGRRQNRLYVVSAILVVTLAVVLFYTTYPSGKNERDPAGSRAEPAGARLETVDTSPETAGARPEAVETPSEGSNVSSETVAVPAESADMSAKADIQDEKSQPVMSLAAKPEPSHTLIETAAGLTAESNPEVTKLVAEAVDLIGGRPSRIIEARDKLNAALTMPMNTKQRAFIKDQLSNLAERWLFSKSLFPNDQLCGSYEVKPGDQLRAIAQQHKVPYQILMRINNIRDPRSLQAGQTIKVINGPFHAKIYRSTLRMDLYLQNTLVRSFPVGLGKPGMETPTGLWRVKLGQKLVTPIWTNPLTHRTYHPEDADYPLGSRWIGLEGLQGQAKGRDGFAIHGTKDPDEIGTASSQGCIRLHNGNAILVYDVLVPVYSLVRIEE